MSQKDCYIFSNKETNKQKKTATINTTVTDYIYTPKIKIVIKLEHAFYSQHLFYYLKQIV